MHGGAALFNLKGVTAGYSGNTVLSHIDLKVETGTWLTILGPNGAGKSTLLKTLIGILKPKSGDFLASKASYGYVPQQLQCPKDFLITTREYLSLNPAASDPLEDNAWVKRLKLEGFLDTPLSQLSGGQFKRAELVFALLRSPDVLFLDEYLEGLDSASKREAEEIMKELNEMKGKTIIEVSHDLISVTKSSKRVLFVNGRITYDGPPSGQGFHSCLHHAYGDEAALREEHS